LIGSYGQAVTLYSNHIPYVARVYADVTMTNPDVKSTVANSTEIILKRTAKGVSTADESTTPIAIPIPKATFSGRSELIDGCINQTHLKVCIG